MIDLELAKFNIYQITDQIYLGRYPSPKSLTKLNRLGVSVIINVASGKYVDDRFTIYSMPLIDLREIPIDVAIRVAGKIKESINSNQKIYVHCVAGQNRSPGCVFLGLLALGYSEIDAVNLIEENTLKSIAKHESIITDNVIDAVKQYYSKSTSSEIQDIHVENEKSWGLKCILLIKRFLKI